MTDLAIAPKYETALGDPNALVRVTYKVDLLMELLPTTSPLVDCSVRLDAPPIRS